MSTLRDYQETLTSDIRVEFQKGHRCVLAVSPTGSGKTNTTAHMVKRTIERGGTALFTVHRQELMDQSVDAFKREGIDHGCIAAGYQFNPAQPAQIASIDTLRRRLDKYPGAPSLIVVDEAAHSCSPTWKFVIDNFPKSRIVGLTATPERLDGKGLKEIYTTMVRGPSVRWLIDQGYLVDYEVFEPGVPDVSDVKTVAGDYARDESENLMDTPTITGDAIREYRKHCDGKRAVAFCVSIKHSQHVAQQFNDAGVRAVHVGGDTPRAQRKAAINAFRAGEIKVLTSVDIFGEGFDLPALECAIMLRPTQSLALYLQQVGRVLRPLYAEGYDLKTLEGRLAAIQFSTKPRALILDHAGNVRRHLLPDEDRNWNLDGRQKRKKKEVENEIKIKIRNCPACLYVHRPSPACPYCGHVYPIQSREVDHVEGNLVKMDKAAMAKQKRDRGWEDFNAKTRQELEALATERGYQNPMRWAEYKLAAREKRPPDFQRAAREHNAAIMESVDA